MKKKITIAVIMLALLVIVAPSKAQVAVAPSPVAKQQFFSQSGSPLASGCLFTYITGTSTPLATYTDYTGTATNPNPVILDGGGFASLWLSNATYRFVLVSNGGVNCASGTTQYTIDGVSAYTVINTPQNLFLLGATSDPSGTAGELAYRTDLGCFRGFTTFWDCLVTLTATQTLSNKTLNSPAFTGTATGLSATSPTLTSPTITGLTLGGVSVATGNPTNFQSFTNAAAGTGLNLLAKIAPAGGGSPIQSTAITDTGGALGVVIAGAGTSGIALVQIEGQVLCVYDGSTTAGDYVQISSSVIGNCHDSGVAAPSFPTAGGQVMGRVLTSNVGAGTYLTALESETRVGVSVASVATQVSAATNFGVNLGTQTLIASVPISGVVNVAAQPIQSLLGVSCGAGSNSVNAVISFTAPGGTVETLSFGSLTIANNGTLDQGANTFSSLQAIIAKAGTAVTYTTSSTLVSAGCSPVPQYQVFSKATY